MPGSEPLKASLVCSALLPKEKDKGVQLSIVTVFHELPPKGSILKWSLNNHFVPVAARDWESHRKHGLNSQISHRHNNLVAKASGPARTTAGIEN